MTDSPSPPEAANPVPDAGQGESTVQLGPDLSIYPEEFRTPVETPAPTPQPETLAPAEGEQVETPSADAGPEADEPEQTRRQRGQNLYERGLAEGRAAAERERLEQARLQQANETARAATARVEELFSSLESPNPVLQDQARQAILQLYRGNQQATALQTSTRQQVLFQIAQDFLKLRGADGVDDAAYEELHTAPDPSELAKRAIAIGRKQREDEVQRLQAELTQLRGRLVGHTASPAPANGVAGTSGEITIDQYRTMSPAEARKLTPRQIDALTAALAHEAQYVNGRA